MPIPIRSAASPMLVIGHRGACAHAPENTLPAFEHARQLGAAWVETDVKRTRDGALVLMHDARVDRTTDGLGAVRELTLDEIRGLDAGAWFDAAFAGTPVPALEELVAWARRTGTGPCLHVGAKLGADGLATVADLLQGHGIAAATLVICSDVDLLVRLRDRCDGIAVGLLYSEDPDSALERAAAARLDFLHPHRRLVSPEIIDRAHAAGFSVAAAVDPDRALVDERRRWGLDAINCDDPGLCR